MAVQSVYCQQSAVTLMEANLYGLEPPELEVIRLLWSGLTVEEMTKTLGIGPRALATHRARIMCKLGARNSAHLEHIIATMKRCSANQTDIVYLDDNDDVGSAPMDPYAYQSVVFAS